MNEYRFVPQQSTYLDREAARRHRLHRGLTPAEAELGFLQHARLMHFYGIRLYPALVCFASLASLELLSCCECSCFELCLCSNQVILGFILSLPEITHVLFRIHTLANALWLLDGITLGIIFRKASNNRTVRLLKFYFLDLCVYLRLAVIWSMCG